MRGPMRSISGRNARARKSKGGAAGLWVPPSSVSAEGPEAVRSAGNTVWITRPVLPAVPIANRYSPGFTPRGWNTSVCDPRVAPSTSAPPTATAALTAVRCWRNSPGFRRPARIFSMENGVPVTSESASAVRRICPPPSPCDPSIVITTSSLDAHDLPERVHDLDEVPLRLHDRVDRLVGAGRLVDDVRVLPALDARRRGLVIGQGEAPLRLVAGHRAPRPVTAALVAVRVPAPPHDVRARAHAAGNDAEVTRTRAHRSLARHEHLAAPVTLAVHVVVMAVHRGRPGLERRDPGDASHGADDRVHHEPAIREREVLRPAHGLHVVVEVRRALFEVREVFVGKIGQVLSHVLLGQLDEVRADLVTHSARAAVEHEPHVVGLVQAHLDEVVACPEGAEMHDVVRVLDLPVLARDRLEPRLEPLPGLELRRRRVLPRTLVAAARRTAVRHSALDRRAHLAQVVRQVARGQRSTDRRHAAPDVDADGGRDDGPDGRDDAADGRSHTPVDVRHRRHPPAHARQSRHVVELLGRCVLEADAADPRLDRHATLDLDRLVRRFRAHDLPRFFNIPIATIVATKIALSAEATARYLA